MVEKLIGSNFTVELRVAGLLGLPFAWNAAGEFTFSDAMTGEQIAAIQAVYAAHDPEKSDPGKTYDEKVAAGLTLVSTATAALDAVYAIDVAASHTISGIAAGVASRNRLPGGGSTFHYADMGGVPHAFTSSDFLNLAAAVEDYLYELTLVRRTLAAGGATEWPSSSMTIA